jgi:hypothetical protein
MSANTQVCPYVVASANCIRKTYQQHAAPGFLANIAKALSLTKRNGVKPRGKNEEKK